MIDGELAQRASLRSGLGNAFNSLPEETQESITEMANGGIVAFADGGPTQEEIDAARRPFVGYPMAVRPRDKQYGESRILERLGAFMVPPTYAVDKPAAPAVSAAAPALSVEILVEQPLRVGLQPEPVRPTRLTHPSRKQWSRWRTRWA
jgi:hypothetical protein